MRRLAIFSGSTMLIVGGCALVDTYDYSSYGDTSSSSSSGTTSSTSGSSSTSSGTPKCPAEICNNPSDPSCLPDQDCTVQATTQSIFGEANHQQVKTATVSLDGSLLIGGEYAGDPSFVNGAPLTLPTVGQFGAFVAKIDDKGVGTFAKSLSTGGATIGVAPAPDGLYALGRSGTPANGFKLFVQRVPFDMGTMWRHDFGKGPNQFGGKVISNGGPSDPIYIAGTSTGPIESNSTLCPGYVDMSMTTGPNPFVFRLKPNDGTCDWGFPLGGGVITSMTIANGRLIITGYYTNLDDINISSPQQAPGDTSASAFIAAYDTTSSKPVKPTWAYTYAVKEDGGSATFLSVTSDKDTTYVTGTLFGTITTDSATTIDSKEDADMIVMAYETLGGKFLWARRIGGLGTQLPQSIVKTTDGFYVAGFHTNPQPSLSSGMAIVEDQRQGMLCFGKKRCSFLMKWNNDGTTAWSREFGDDETAKDPTILLAADTVNLWIATSREAPLSFGGDSLIPVGGQDIMVAKFPFTDLPH